MAQRLHRCLHRDHPTHESAAERSSDREHSRTRLGPGRTRNGFYRNDDRPFRTHPRDPQGHGTNSLYNRVCDPSDSGSGLRSHHVVAWSSGVFHDLHYPTLRIPPEAFWEGHAKMAEGVGLDVDCGVDLVRANIDGCKLCSQRVVGYVVYRV